MCRLPIAGRCLPIVALLLTTVSIPPLVAAPDEPKAQAPKCLLTLTGHNGIVLCVSYRPRGDQLVSAGRDSQVFVWDAASGKQLANLVLKGGGDAYAAAWGLQHKTLSPTPRGGGKRAADDYGFVFEQWSLACGRSDNGKPGGEVVLWDVQAKKERKSLQGHTASVCWVACTADGRRLASASYDSTARIWDAATGKELFTLKGHQQGAVYMVAFDATGKLLATGGSDQKVILWDTATGKALHTLAGHTGAVYGACFSRNGKRLVTGGDQTARVWDVETGKELLTLTGHTGSVNSVAFSPDDRLIASSSGDNTVKLWDAATGKELATLVGHTAMVRCVSFNPVKPQLASASWDKTVKIWDISGVKPEGGAK